MSLELYPYHRDGRQIARLTDVAYDPDRNVANKTLHAILIMLRIKVIWNYKDVT